MKTRTTIAMMLIGLSLLLGMTACAASDGMMNPKMETGMTPRMDGMLMGREGHQAAGKASLGTGMSGQSVLTLSDIKVDRVPDGIVYLTKDADHRHGVELGKLDRFEGTVKFVIPTGVNPDDYDSVVIWCRKFNVEIGRAYLPPKMM